MNGHLLFLKARHRFPHQWTKKPKRPTPNATESHRARRTQATTVRRKERIDHPKQIREFHDLKDSADGSSRTPEQMDQDARRFRGRIVLMSARDRSKNRLRQLIAYLNSTPLTESQKRSAIGFIGQMNRAKLGRSVGLQIRDDIIKPRKVIVVKRFSTARSMQRDCTLNHVLDHSYDSLVFFDQAYFLHLIVSDLLINFGNHDHHTEFVTEVSINFIGALTEILLETPNIFVENWKIFMRGHYICGGLSEDQFFVY